MPRIYPHPIRPDTRSHAERRLYAAFEKQLPEEMRQKLDLR